jgi:hypothetical protein
MLVWMNKVVQDSVRKIQDGYIHGGVGWRQHNKKTKINCD